MAPHSSTLAWKLPWTEERGRMQSMESLRVRHDWATSLLLFTFLHWRRKWQPTPVFLPGESQGWGAWWAAIYGIVQSWTRLKRLSSSSSSTLILNYPQWIIVRKVKFTLKQWGQVKVQIQIKWLWAKARSCGSFTEGQVFKVPTVDLWETWRQESKAILAFVLVLVFLLRK